jgi:hypothetical protein
MTDLLDALHRWYFDPLFSLDEEARKAKEKLLREAGLPEKRDLGGEKRGGRG